MGVQTGYIGDRSSTRIGHRVSVRSTNRGDSLSARKKCLALEGDVTDEGTKAVRARASEGRTQRLGAVPTLRDQPQDGPQVAGALLRRERCRSADGDGCLQPSIGWQKLGIRHERIAPGKPEQNGRHELLGLDPIETDTWELTFGSVHLGRIERPSGGRFRLRFVRCS
jgi:hypothetical protein